MKILDRKYRIQYKMVLPENEPMNYWLNFGNDIDGYPTEEDAMDYINDFGHRYAKSFDCPLIFDIFVIETREVNTITVGGDDNV